MNHAIAPFTTAAGRIDLARQPDFALGAMRVLPSCRQVVAGPRSETVQPRVMQVLVALAQPSGTVVSRDRLIERCWDGVVVGDDAINRCIAKVRHLAALTDPPAFEVETVPRVGYRLTILSHGAPEAAETPALAPPALAPPVQPPPSPAPRRIGRGGMPWRRAIAGAVAIVALGGIALHRGGQTGGYDARTVIGLALSDNAAPLAEGFATELTRLAGPGSHVAIVNPAPDAPPALVLEVAVPRLEGELRAEAMLRTAPGAPPIWIETTGPERDLGTARRHLAHVTARVLGCAGALAGGLPAAEPAALSSLLTACGRLDEAITNPNDMNLGLWRAAAAANPERGDVQATAAAIAADLGLASDEPQAVALRGEARALLARAEALHARPGLIAVARAALMRRDDLAAWRDVLTPAARLDPECAPLRIALGDLARHIGRMQDAVAEVRRAVALEPAAAAYRQDLVATLAAAGYTDDARRALAAAEQDWADMSVIREARSRFDLRYGDAARMLKAIDAGQEMPNSDSTWQQSFARPYLLARANPTPENIATATRAALLATAHMGVPLPLSNLAVLGQVEAALGLLDRADAARDLTGGTDILFRAYMRPLWRDRRFMAFAHRMGLVRLWQAADQWPDFCFDATLPYHCRAEARALTTRP